MGGKFKDKSKSSALYIIAFGIGLVLSCIFPTGLILFLSSVIMIVVGIALYKC